jgi:hypothetical protein
MTRRLVARVRPIQRFTATTPLTIHSSLHCYPTYSQPKKLSPVANDAAWQRATPRRDGVGRGVESWSYHTGSDHQPTTPSDNTEMPAPPQHHRTTLTAGHSTSQHITTHRSTPSGTALYGHDTTLQCTAIAKLYWHTAAVIAALLTQPCAPARPCTRPFLTCAHRLCAQGEGEGEGEGGRERVAPDLESLSTNSPCPSHRR